MQTKLVVLLLSLTLPCAAWADIAVSNLSNTPAGADEVKSTFSFTPFPVPFGFTVFDDAAQSFTTGASASVLEKVTLSMAGSPGGSGFNVALYGDGVGLPGFPLLPLVGNSNPSTAGLYDYTGTYALAPNTTYWVVAFVGTTKSR